MSMTPLTCVSEQEISLFRKKKKEGSPPGTRTGRFGLISKLQVLFSATLGAWLQLYLAALERDHGHHGRRKQLQEFKVLTKGNSRCVLPILLGHKAFFPDAHRKMTRSKLSMRWTKFRIVL